MPYGHPGGASTRGANRHVQYTVPHCNVRVLYRLGAQGADPDRRGDIDIVVNFTSMHEARLPCKEEITSSWPLARLSTSIEECGALTIRGRHGTGASILCTKFGKRGASVSSARWTSTMILTLGSMRSNEDGIGTTPAIRTS